jgi:hypothetical protein
VSYTGSHTRSSLPLFAQYEDSALFAVSPIVSLEHNPSQGNDPNQQESHGEKYELGAKKTKETEEISTINVS